MSAGLLFTGTYVSVSGTTLGIVLSLQNVSKNAIAQTVDDAADSIRYNGKLLKVRFFRSDIYGNLSPLKVRFL
ncbi:hypothetical protein [Vallitalea sp.]|uniref:hypothetical protein n=1 Tax=Vallitalea sp. TaxID=1882829 RepID=UPI0025E27936|nr:hypothetical protein [Vallitalea sp.]MCT4686964.1 hypothetical protein [Vallitalea sp.]